MDETIRKIAGGTGLEAHFQPLVSLKERALFGYEGLIRGVDRERWPTAESLFTAAAAADLGMPLELASARVVIETFARQALPGHIAVNFSAPCIERIGNRSLRTLEFLLESGIAPSRVIIELTEHDRVADPGSLKDYVSELRKLGFALALDDFGAGHSSLRLWAELAPEFVKIDRYFISGLHADPARFQCVKALMQLGSVFGTRLVAEGVEAEDDLRVVRDLGIELAQGFLLGMPEAEPKPALPMAVTASLRAKDISVFPEIVRLPQRQALISQLVVARPTLPARMTNNEVVEFLAKQPEAQALAVVDENDAPVGIINRHDFLDRYAHLYHRELFGKRPCTTFMNANPFIVDRSATLETLTDLLKGQDQRYLADGLIVCDNRRYLGLVTGESLVRAIAEIRIEAARYANPLTFLPGNIPISEHIARLLKSGAAFTACYWDLNQFKPFNDQYGYWRGDEMIKLAARCITSGCDPQRDFVGHVGGDDFVVLYQSADWKDRAERSVEAFNTSAVTLFDEADRENGGIHAEDRHGRPTFFALTTIAVGAVAARDFDFRRHEDVASAAAAAKREAKRRGVGVFELRPARLAAEERDSPVVGEESDGGERHQQYAGPTA